MADNDGAEDICLKWNKPVDEKTCNICKDQCELSIADPDNFIAKKLIVDMELVKANRIRHHQKKDNAGEEEPPDDMDFLKDEIEETFKDRADSIIDSLGLSHMKNEEKEEEQA